MANKFEKEVQKTLEELQFNPSEKVWQNVQKRIGNQKRRGTFFLLFSAAIFITIMALFLHNAPVNTKVNKTQESEIAKNVPATAKERIQADEEAANTGTGIKNTYEKEANPLAGKLSVQEQSLVSLELLADELKGFPDKQKEKLPIFANEEESHLQSVKSQSTFPEKSGNKRIYSTKTKTLAPKNEIALENFIPHANTEIDPDEDFITYYPVNIKTTETSANSQKNTAPEQNDSYSKSKWRFGLSLTPGFFYMNRSFLSFPASSPNYENAYPGNSSGTPPSSSYISSPKFRKGVAFFAAIRAVKPLSAQTEFSTGIEYQHFNLRQKMTYYSGIVNSIADSVYLNQFHYLTLPASFHFKNHIGKLPVTLEIGAGISGLISANALQYDGTKYYKDNSLFNNVQVNLRGGIYINLLNTNNFTLELGPYYQYNLNQPAKEGVFSERHFNFAGLKAEIQLKNK